MEVVTEKGNRLSVYGSDCATIGETAYRHGVLIHQLSDEVGDTGPRDLFEPSEATPVGGGTSGSESEGSAAVREPAPPAKRRPTRSPLRPLRYEIRRLLGVPTTPLVAAAVLVASVVVSVVLARNGRTPVPTLLAGWPTLSPLPPAAIGAGLLGAFSFADEYRYPALTTGRGAVPRRLGLLLAKLLVATAVGLVLAVLVVVADLQTLRLVYGGELIPVPKNWPTLCASWLGLTVGCAWAGVLGAGVFRVAAAGVAAVLAVPVALAPLLQKATSGPSGRPISGLPARLRGFVSLEWPAAADRWLTGVLRVVAQPVGVALALSLTALLCAYLFTGLRRKARW